MKHTGRPSWAHAVILVCALLFSHPARPDPTARWRDLAQTVFVPIPQGADQSQLLLPEVFAEDASGFLWAAGETGLARWDGYAFRYYGPEKTPPDGLHNHYVTALHRDAEGRLWVGTVAGELAIYDAAHDRFAVQPISPPGAPAWPITAIEDDRADGLWVASKGALLHLDAAGAVTSRVRHEAARPGSLPEGALLTVLCDERGALWVGGTGGLVRAGPDSGAFTPVPLPAPPGQIVEVSHLRQDSAGRIWVATHQNGAFVLAPGQSTARHLAGQGEGEADLASLQVTDSAEIAPGTIWLSTYGGGIVEVDAATLRTRRLRHDPLTPRSLDSDIVYALHRDRSGLVWLGTQGGLTQYRPSPGILTVFGTPGRPGGMSAVDATALMAQADGTLWVVSHHNGVDIIAPDGHVIANLPVDRVHAIAEQADGAVLLGTRSGLFRVDAATRRITRVTVPGRRVTAGVYALFTEGGHVWLGGIDDGLWELGGTPDGQMRVLRHEDLPRLPNAAVHVIGVAPGGAIAIGTEEGFCLLDPASGAMERVVHDAADPLSLGPGTATAFLTDRHGRLWVGTDEAGAYVQTGRDTRGRRAFHRIGVADGLPNADVDNLLPDASGRIWASTDNGLAVIDPETLAVRALRAVDGVAIATYWTDSGAVTPQGDIVFGGNGGITVVQPNRTTDWRFRPQIQPTDIRAGGVPWLGDPDRQPIELWPDANSLAVEFAALDLSAPQSNRYRYRLEGYDPGWLRTDARLRLAAYTNLPPGDYTLLLQGSNRQGAWSEPPARLRVRVHPAWFQTLWCRLAEGAALAVLAWGLVQGRTVILRARQRDLEQLVVERTAQLSHSQQELHRIAHEDTLTGLPNRRAFNEKIQAVMEGGAPSGFALMLIDLDGFKGVNDTLGHDAGDAVLVLAAERIREAVRDRDFVARLGGDEFAILLLEGRGRAVELVGARVVAAMSALTSVGDARVKLGASAGAAIFPRDGVSQEALYKHADLALYEAKRAGRGAWRVYGGAPVE